MLFLIENSYFTVRNILILPTLGILMRIQLALFWGNFYLYNYVSKYITNLIRTNKVRNRRLHSTFRFIEDLGALNDVGEFGRDFYEIYSKELELKMEHNGSHEIFLDLDVLLTKLNLLIRYMTNWSPLTFILLECHQLQVVYYPPCFIVPFCQNL